MAYEFFFIFFLFGTRMEDPKPVLGVISKVKVQTRVEGESIDRAPFPRQ